ncbi:unnamed protein product [Aureobasidium pullulans]|nr:unnamed protein product [Aureobasidium pullulans]
MFRSALRQSARVATVAAASSRISAVRFNKLQPLADTSPATSSSKNTLYRANNGSDNHHWTCRHPHWALSARRVGRLRAGAVAGDVEACCSPLPSLATHH